MEVLRWGVGECAWRWVLWSAALESVKRSTMKKKMGIARRCLDDTHRAEESAILVQQTGGAQRPCGHPQEQGHAHDDSSASHPTKQKPTKRRKEQQNTADGPLQHDARFIKEKP